MKCFFDFPEVKQVLFQDAATSVMYFIVSSHNTIMFYLCIIIGLVIVLMFYIVITAQNISIKNFLIIYERLFYLFYFITIGKLVKSNRFKYKIKKLYKYVDVPLIFENYFNVLIFRINIRKFKIIKIFSNLALLKNIFFNFYLIKYFFKLKTLVRVKINKLISLQFISNKIQKWYEQNLLETFWTEYPSILVAILVMPILIFLFTFEEVETGQWNFVVKVIGNQWFWSYEVLTINGNYDWFLFFSPDLGVVLPKNINFESRLIAEVDLIPGQLRLLEVDNILILPVNCPIHVYVTSVDVIHSWSIPSLGIKIDAVPGRLNTVSFMLTRPGIFYGQCSELCGLNHSAMPIQILGIFHEYIKIFK